MAQRLDSIRKARNVPALGAAFIRGDGSVTSAVVGVRKRGTDVRATTEDKWPLASNTKAMTATLLATFVEQGALTWETTLAELFPELRAGFRGKFGAITVTHLLAHYAGLPRNFDGTGIRRTAPTPAEQRLNLVRKTGSQALRSAPGTKMEYSNLGYVIAGAVAERVGGKPWEALMRERVFAPLGIEGCGFGGALTNRDTEDVGGPAGRCAARLPTGGSSCSISSVASMAQARCSNPKRTRRCTSRDSVATTRSAGTSFRSHGRAASCSTTLGAPGAWIMPSCGSCRRATSRCSR